MGTTDPMTERHMTEDCCQISYLILCCGLRYPLSLEWKWFSFRRRYRTYNSSM